MIVTIDGPAGAGKSTAARALAGRLGYAFLDTGAMFRTVALAAMRAGVGLGDDRSLSLIVERMRLEMRPDGAVILDRENVSAEIRTSEVSRGASVVAASAAVRPRLAELQRQIAAGQDIVCEGRDQGTVVFPDAGCKFFLVANPEERLERRIREMESKGAAVDHGALKRQLAERDERDSTRTLAPLRPAADAIILDSTCLNAEEVVQIMEAEVRRRLGES